jgi:hypothetical protein
VRDNGEEVSPLDRHERARVLAQLGIHRGAHQVEIALAEERDELADRPVGTALVLGIVTGRGHLGQAAVPLFLELQ